MSLTPVADIGPKWNGFEAVTFDGQFDTHIKTGEDYNVRTLASIFTMEPENHAKDQSPAFIPSCYPGYDAREHAVQRAQGCYVALTGDIDGGDHPLEQLDALLHAFAPGCAYLVYSSPNSRPGNRRWRIIMPLAETVSFDDWHDAQNALFNFMEHGGVQMDRALDRAAQPVFLPNVPEIHAKTAEPLRSPDGAPLYYERSTTGANAPGLNLSKGALAAGLHAIREKRSADDKAREQMRRDAEARKKLNPGDGHDIIAGFNRSNSIANLLELYNYQQSPRNADDWRSAYQEGESYATRIMGDKWVSLSMSDANAKVGETCKSGCFGDAYDLFVHYEHKGDHKAAFRALHAERRGSAPPPERYNYTPAEDVEFDPETGDPILSVPEYGDEAEPETARADGAPTPSLPFFWFRDAEPNLDANDFVEGLLTTSAMSVIYGPSNCGKTFFVVDLGLHVAWGREWRGRAVDRGAVVYLSLEGAQGIRNRLAAFRKHHGLDGEALPFVAMPKPVNLLNDDADVNAVIALVEHVAAETGLHVAMVIVDTLSRAMAGGNENSPEDMTAIVGNCDRIRDATGAHVCIVHHSGKDEARGARGHSSLRAATDTEIEIKRDPELTISSVRIAKQRDLEADEPFAFSLHKVALGTNRRGKDVTSCIAVEAEKSVALSRDPNKLSDKESQALECLARCIEAAGFEHRNTHVSPGVSVVTLHHWKQALSAAGVTERNNNDVSRVQFNRVKKALENKGQIVTAEDVVWLA